MSGGILQLVAYGAQDVYITGNPEITFFKMVYRRYTNFSMETKEIQLDNYQFRTTSLVIPRYGDLVHRMYLRITIPEILLSKGSKFGWARLLGFGIIKKLQLEIGGSIINEGYNIWSLIWSSLARNNNLDRGLAHILGVLPELYTYNDKNKPEYNLFISLPLYFRFNEALALPLIALQYHEVKINFTFQDLFTLCCKNDNFIKYDKNQLHIKDATLLVNYIYLDSEERRKFASVGHEYVMEQYQSELEISITSKIQTIDLNFNHPSKEIFWVLIRDQYITDKQFIYYPYSTVNTFNKLSVQLLYESSCIDHCFCKFYNHIPYIVCKPGTKCITPNKKILLINNNCDTDLIFNTQSLIYKGVNYIDKISGTIILTKYGKLEVNNVSNTFNIAELSIPSCQFIDTRFYSDDPHVNIFIFGMYIDGQINPINYGSLYINGVQLGSRRDCNYYNYVLPDQYHRNTPLDGVNIYSFAAYPEKLQPSGSINFSRLDNVKLLLEFKDITFGKDKLYVFCQSFNILRVMSGMAGLAYTN